MAEDLGKKIAEEAEKRRIRAAMAETTMPPISEETLATDPTPAQETRVFKDTPPLEPIMPKVLAPAPSTEQDLYESTKLSEAEPASPFQYPADTPSAAPEHREGYSPLDYAVVGATPLLMGLLMGNMGDAFDVASKGLLDYEKREFDEASKDLDMRRKMASAKRGTSKGFQKEKGKGGAPLYFDPSSGKYRSSVTGEIYTGDLYAPSAQLQVREKLEEKEKSDIRMGKMNQIRPDSEGRLNLIDRRDGSRTVLESLEGYSMKQKEKAGILVDKFMSDTRKARENFETIETFNTSIEGNNPIADQLAIFRLAKSAQGGGVLTDRDVERFGGDQAMFSRLRQFFKNQAKGTLTEKNRQFMRELGDAMRRGAQKALQSRADAYIESKRKFSPVKEQDFSQAINATLTPYLGKEGLSVPFKQDKRKSKQDKKETDDLLSREKALLKKFPHLKKKFGGE